MDDYEVGQGCQVYPHVTEATPATDDRIAIIVSLWMALDGQRECDLAVAMANADERRADQFSTTLGEAVQPAQSAAACPAWRILEASATISLLTPDELTEFARQLVAADAPQADRLIDALIDAFEIQPRKKAVRRDNLADLADAVW